MMYKQLLAHKNTIIGLGSFSWISLGGYRGAQEYNKNYNKYYKCYTEKKFKKKPQYYYLSCAGRSCFFATRYIILFPFAFIDELYNIEKYIRGIKEDDK
jgi:hypothetical protein